MQFNTKKRVFKTSKKSIVTLYIYAFITDWSRIIELQSDNNEKKKIIIIIILCNLRKTDVYRWTS